MPVNCTKFLAFSSKSEALGSDGTGEISRDSFQGIPVNSRTAAPTVAQSDSLLKPEIDILNHLKDRCVFCPKRGLIHLTI